MIISPSFFKYDLYIPNAEQVAGGSDNYTGLIDCINMVEREVLLKSLRLNLYNELQGALPITNDSLDKWKWLINGKEYDGKVWIGLGNEKSLLCYAVYSAFLDINSHFWTTTGAMHPTPENAQTVTSAFKYAKAWQTFVRKYQNGCEYYPEQYYYNGALVTDWLAGNREDVEISLYEYLNDNKELYNWDNEKFGRYDDTKNSFGL